VLSHRTETEIEHLVSEWLRGSKRYELSREIIEEAERLMERKKHPAPDCRTAVKWATVRVMDVAARYDHGTGAVRRTYARY